MDPKYVLYSPPLPDLGMSENLIEMLPKGGTGLVFITGLAGSGKTTTANSYARYLGENFNQSLAAIMNPKEFKYFDNTNWVLMLGETEFGQEIAAINEAISMRPDAILIDDIYSPEAFELAVKASSESLVIFTHHAGTLTEALKNHENYVSLSSNPAEVESLLRKNLQLILCEEIHQTSHITWSGEFKTFIPKPK